MFAALGGIKGGQLPDTPATGLPGTLPGRASTAKSAAHSQATVDFQTAQALQQQQQAAYAEAEAIITEARQFERAAHARLTDASNATSNALGVMAEVVAGAAQGSGKP